MMPLLRDPSPARPAGADVEPFVGCGGNPKERESLELVQKFSLDSPPDLGSGPNLSISCSPGRALDPCEIVAAAPPNLSGSHLN